MIDLRGARSVSSAAATGPHGADAGARHAVGRRRHIARTGAGARRAEPRGKPATSATFVTLEEHFRAAAFSTPATRC
jgi:hypothetical protein